MSKIQIGWAEEIFDITKPISLVGQFAERISEYVEKPLTVTALAVDSGEEQMVLCSADLVSVSVPFVKIIRDRLEGNTLGLDPMKVVISAIHTHTGPGFVGRGVGIRSLVSGGGGAKKILKRELPPNKKYIEKVPVEHNDNIMDVEEITQELVDKIVKAILGAWQSRKSGSFVNAFGRAVVGMCRRVCYSDGTAQMWGDTNLATFTELEGGNDSGIELLYIFDEKNQLTGVVANLACPAQCVQHRLFVSPDFWGEAKLLLRKHFGEHIFLLPLCSAAGDQCPVDLVRWVEPETDVNDPNIKRNMPPKRVADPSMFDLRGMKKVGKRVANEIIEVYNEGLNQSKDDVPFTHHVHNMLLPLRRVTMAEESDARKVIQEYFQNKKGDVDYNDVAKLHKPLGILQRVELQKKVDVVETEVHIMRLGGIAIATNPFELFLDYGNQMKARSLAEQTFIVQLACGGEGYLPTKKAEQGGHYSAFHASGSVGHEGGELLVRETLMDINKMFQP